MHRIVLVQENAEIQSKSHQKKVPKKDIFSDIIIARGTLVNRERKKRIIYLFIHFSTIFTNFKIL